MKTILLALTFAAAAFRVHSDGTIAFANSRVTKFYIEYPDHSRRLATAEDNLLIGVFYGTNDYTPFESLVPAPGLATIGPEPGLMTNAPVVFPLPGTTVNSVVQLQVRAWDATLGPDGWRAFIEPWPSWPPAGYCEGGGRFYGETEVRFVTLGDSNGPGAVIWQRFDSGGPNRLTQLLVMACSQPPVHTNLPPQVTLSWAAYRSATQFSPDFLPSFEQGNGLKFKAAATDPDGSISKVELFANDLSVAVLTNNPPFDVIWILPVGRWDVYAVATDNDGATNRSRTLTAFGRLGGGRPRESYVDLIEPADGKLFATSDTFTIATEMFSGTAYAGPVEFTINGQPVGQAGEGALYTAMAPPVSIVVSNLTEGTHVIGFNFLGDPPCAVCDAVTNTIRVVKLGIGAPRHTPAGHAQFDIVTSFPGRHTIIEASPNLYDWMPLATNIPVSTSFIFTDTSFVSRSNWFYRARVPLD